MGDKDILCSLAKAMKEGLAVAISVQGHGKPLVVGVKDIRDDYLVMLEPYTIYGVKLNNTFVEISEIEKCTIFNQRYDDERFVKIRSIKETIRKNNKR